MTPERIDRAIEANKRPAGLTAEGIKAMFVACLVIMGFLAAVVVVLIFQTGAVSRSTRSVHDTQSQLEVGQRTIDQHTFENRAISCVLISKVDAPETPPASCFDPHVLAFVPPQYSYTAAR